MEKSGISNGEEIKAIELDGSFQKPCKGIKSSGGFQVESSFQSGYPTTVEYLESARFVISR
jgi:hypothetical protein